MQNESCWKKFFQNWPEKVSQSGVLVTSFDEQIPFNGFLISADLLLLDRKIPDTIGARKILLPFENIVGVKITDVIDIKEFSKIGFEEVK